MNILSVSRSLENIQSSEGSGERIMLINDGKLLTILFKGGWGLTRGEGGEGREEILEGTGWKQSISRQRERGE